MNRHCSTSAMAGAAPIMSPSQADRKVFNVGAPVSTAIFSVSANGSNSSLRVIVSSPSNILLEHDPEKWVPVFPRDKREAFARRSCSNKKIVGNIRMSVSVEMREVAKSFGQTRALKGVSMDIAAGSVHGL